jgi:hypothetical protein
MSLHCYSLHQLASNSSFSSIAKSSFKNKMPTNINKYLDFGTIALIIELPYKFTI